MKLISFAEPYLIFTSLLDHCPVSFNFHITEGSFSIGLSSRPQCAAVIWCTDPWNNHSHLRSACCVPETLSSLHTRSHFSFAWNHLGKQETHCPYFVRKTHWKGLKQHAPTTHLMRWTELAPLPHHCACYASPSLTLFSIPTLVSLLQSCSLHSSITLLSNRTFRHVRTTPFHKISAIAVSSDWRLENMVHQLRSRVLKSV